VTNFAIEMFSQSIDKHQLRYVVYIGDGDTNSFGEVKAALCKKYGENYPK